MLSTDSMLGIDTTTATIYLPTIELQHSRGVASAKAAMHVLLMPARRQSGGSAGVSLHEILEPRSFTGLGVEWGP
jgi:hypothetical protein